MTSIRTCESTCIGHPDKLCDLIADTVLDDLLFEDPSARCAVEVMATKDRIIVAGEIHLQCQGLHPGRCTPRTDPAGYSPIGWRISVHVHRQSPDIMPGLICFIFKSGHEIEVAL